MGDGHSRIGRGSLSETRLYPPNLVGRGQNIALTGLVTLISIKSKLWMRSSIREEYAAGWIASLSHYSTFIVKRNLARGLF